MVDLYLPSTKSAVGISVIGQLIAQGRAEKIKEKPLVPSEYSASTVCSTCTCNYLHNDLKSFKDGL